jgi:hypothetical protein
LLERRADLSDGQTRATRETSASGAGSPSPKVNRERLADAVADLAGAASAGYAHAQLRALSAVLRSLDVETAEVARRGPLERTIAAGVRDEDEPAVVEAMRRLAALDRAAAPPVDWSVAPGG